MIENTEFVKDILLYLIQCRPNYKGDRVSNTDNFKKIVKTLCDEFKPILQADDIVRHSLEYTSLKITDENGVKMFVDELYKDVDTDEKHLINTMLLFTYMVDVCSKLPLNDQCLTLDMLSRVIISSSGGFYSVTLLKKHQRICKNRAFFIKCCISIFGLVGISWILTNK